MTDWLKRDAAPLSGRTWKEIDDAVIRAAKQELAGRRIADFEGPKGWSHVAEPLGTRRPGPRARSGAQCSIPDVMLLSELRKDFTLAWESIDAFERGSRVLDTSPAEQAAREVALAEDDLAFHGGPGSVGFLRAEAGPKTGLGDWSNAGQVAADLVGAVAKLDEAGIAGPYAAVLDPSRFYAYLRAAAERRLSTEADRLEGLFNGIHRSSVIRGGGVFSLRGNDFLIVVGGDLTVGYRHHDETSVHLFCVESVGAHLLTPDAVCTLGGAG
ncbi:MAG TPA: family 1 encapsulin nanocompartment shell protein [Candidatus Binatia bacterium]|nr:family 1 encapsulin nanocompartment shell protein [Candidatus Binatia bacterium]